MGGKFIVGAGLVCGIVLGASLPFSASNLMVEYMENPIVLDVAAPRFFWLVNSADRGVTQSAYRVVVNSTTTGQTVWDSGVTASAATTHVPYAGPPLTSDSVYTWAVQWTDSNGGVAPWSPPARFGTGLMTQAEWAPSAWIGCPLHVDGEPNYSQLRGEFSLDLSGGVTVVQARAYITAVGYYSLRVNGGWAPQWGTPRPHLDPGWTTYESRSLYNAYDLTGVLTNGNNAVAVMLGNGWPDIEPVPGNSSAADALLLDEDGNVNPDALVKARLTGSAPLARAAANGADNVGGLRQFRMQVVVRTSDGKSVAWVTTAGGFGRVHSSSPTVTLARGVAYTGPDGSPPSPSAPTGWQCGAGALQYDNVYNGCTWDATQYTVGWDAPGYDYGSGAWAPAVLRADPGGATTTTMTAQTFPSVGVQLELPAQTLSSPSPGVYVFDIGQNVAGFVRLTLPAPTSPNVTITLRHAEALQHPPYGPIDGNIYVGNLRSARATDVYTTRGSGDGEDGEVFEPVFTYHGFRYVEVTGLPFPPTLDMVTACYSRTGVSHAGSVVFPTLANTLNQFQHAVSWGIGCNLMSVVSDCPQRDERKGWMGDSGLSLLPTHYNYAMGAMYTFWAQNIRDSQVNARDAHPAGSVPDTVPHTFGAYPSDPAWGTAYPGVVHSTWRFLGDTRIAADHYPNLQAYIAFMTGETNKSGVAGIYQSYGDWCPPPAQLGGGQGPKPPTHYTSGVAFVVDLQRMVELATALGKPDDAAAYSTYRAWVLNGFNTAWLNASTGVYGNANGDGLQSANAMAIGIGAAASAGANVVAKVGTALTADVAVTHADASGPHWSTGIIGMRYLHPALTSVGQGKLAVDTLLQTTYPSYGWAFNHPEEPATTLWELPDGPTEGPGMNSRNHHMFASSGGWLFTDLAGIDQARQFTPGYNPADASQSGFKHAILFPRVIDHPSVPYVEGEYASIAGTYAVTWINPNGTAGNGACAAGAPENEPRTLSCPPGGVVTAIAFASFGTPTGSCGSFAKGACDAANTTSILTSACVGKSSCTIDVSTTLFGDPCFDTVKVLDAQLTCSVAADVVITATVPTNARATVRIPFPVGASPSTLTVGEGGSPVFANGAYVPGVPGVTGASISTNDLPAGAVGMTVDVEVGSGTYVLAGSA